MHNFDTYLEQFGEVGYVEGVVSPIVHLRGLPTVKLGEIVVFDNGLLAQVLALKAEMVEVLLLTDGEIRAGQKAARTGEDLRITTSDDMLGQTVSALGPAKMGDHQRGVEVVPLDISRRKRIDRSLETGSIIVDMLLPLGKGQRELVLGDRQTGKTHFVQQAVLSQARLGSICVYAAIGKKAMEIRKLEEFFAKQGVASHVVVVASTSQASPGEIYLTPYTAMTIAEYFRDQGKDVLIVMDDLSTHARFYRELSLLAKKFPGREAYPGDIFYLHSRLLERAGNFIAGDKEAAITCLPIAQTALGDIAGYIQTNLMSMTDGHIYFDTELFYQGRRPAVNPFVSVTRVGRQTQSNVRKQITRELMTLLNNYEKTQSFFRFGAELGEASRQIIAAGDKIINFFNQPLYSVVPANLQTTLFAMVWQNLWDGENVDHLAQIYQSDTVWHKLINQMAESPDFDTLLKNVQVNSSALQRPWQPTTTA